VLHLVLALQEVSHVVVEGGKVTVVVLQMVIAGAVHYQAGCCEGRIG
jgi:hypothetical protein